MTDQERILFEQYVTFKGISFEEGLMYIKYFLNTKDFKSPINRSEEYIDTELVMIDFTKAEESIHFSGAYTIINEGESENRSFSGEIYNEKGKIIFDTNFYRHNENIEQEDRSYNVCEMFTPNKDKMTHKRFTSYKTRECLKNYLEPKYKLSDKELEEFIKRKTTISKSI